MTPEKQRIAIAKACGYKEPDTSLPLWVESEDPFRFIPDYLNDLNAMHDAPHNLSLMQYSDYGTCLNNVVARDNSKNATSYEVFDATAAQRAEAFLRTLGLWIDE